MNKWVFLTEHYDYLKNKHILSFKGKLYFDTSIQTCYYIESYISLLKLSPFWILSHIVTYRDKSPYISYFFTIFLSEVKRLGHVWLCNPMDCSLPGSSVREIFQIRILERVAISPSRGSPQPRDRTQVSCIAGRRFTIWTTKESGFPGGSVVKNLPTSAGDGFDPWVEKITWSRRWQPTPVFLPRKRHGQRGLGGYSPWGRKRVGHDLATRQQQQWCLFLSQKQCMRIIVSLEK